MLLAEAVPYIYTSAKLLFVGISRDATLFATNNSFWVSWKPPKNPHHSLCRLGLCFTYNNTIHCLDLIIDYSSLTRSASTGKPIEASDIYLASHYEERNSCSIHENNFVFGIQTIVVHSENDVPAGIEHSEAATAKHQRFFRNC